MSANPAAIAATPRSAHPPEPWSRNLLHTFEELERHLTWIGQGTDTKDPLLDAFLTVCALSQVLEDFLHRGSLGLEAKVAVAVAHPDKLARHLPARLNLASGVKKLLAMRSLPRIARLVDTLVRLSIERRAQHRERGLLELSGALYGHATELAFLYATADDQPDGSRTALVVRRVARDLAARDLPSGLRRRVLKIPSCFKDLDCHPDDVADLTAQFARVAGSRRLPVTVVGIRTSGSYLAPLCAGYLRLHGFEDASATTVRPKVPLLGHERTRLEARAASGWTLIVDDPPVSGGSFRNAIATLTGIGIARTRMVALILEDRHGPFSAEGRIDERLGIPEIVLPHRGWRIRKVMQDPDARSATPTPDRGRVSRCHAKVRLRSGGRGTVLLKGLGVGWFEEHACETARALRGFVPECSSPDEGVLAMQWVDGPSLADRPDACDEALVRHVARYVAARAERLPIASGRAGDLGDRATGWQVLAQSFARSYSFLSPLAWRSVRRRLASVARTAPRMAVDGRMAPEEWILQPGNRPPLKVDFEEHDFDHTDVAVFDPAFDLGCFSVESRLSSELEDALVAEYVSLTHDREATHRLPYYKLMAGLLKREHLQRQLAEQARAKHDIGGVAVDKTEVERMLSLAVTRTLARMAGADERTSGDKIFAIDVDGVLEDGMLGFSAPTPRAALALRVMKRHGFRPLLASGRSLTEIVARSRAFGLTAAVAEYGSVVWMEERDSPITLVSANERAQLLELRTILARTPDVIVDPEYRYSIRVFQYVNGSRCAAPLDWLMEIIRANSLDALRVVPGDDQLDVVGGQCNKGDAIRAVRIITGARELHAVGDTAEDVSMLDIADRAYAPANVRREVRGRMARKPLFVARRRRQAGLYEIALVAAHGRRRGCHACEKGLEQDVDAALASLFGIRDRTYAGRVCGLLGVLVSDAFRPTGD